MAALVAEAQPGWQINGYGIKPEHCLLSLGLHYSPTLYTYTSSMVTGAHAGDIQDGSRAISVPVMIFC